MSASTRWLAGIAVLIGVIVVGAVAVTTLAGEERVYAEGTPERTVQQYLAAVAENDDRTAAAFLSAELAARCDQVSREPFPMRSQRTIRASLIETVERTDGVDVRVRLTEHWGNGGPFDSGDSSHEEIFRLRQEGGSWRIADAAWPHYCSKALSPGAVPTAMATPRVVTPSATATR